MRSPAIVDGVGSGVAGCVGATVGATVRSGEGDGEDVGDAVGAGVGLADSGVGDGRTTSAGGREASTAMITTIAKATASRATNVRELRMRLG